MSTEWTYFFDEDERMHWSGVVRLPEDLLARLTPQERVNLDGVIREYSDLLPDREERLRMFKEYQEGNVFLLAVQEWVKEKIGWKPCATEEERARRIQRMREYFTSYGEGGAVPIKWLLTEKVPGEMRIRANDAYLAMQRWLNFLRSNRSIIEEIRSVDGLTYRIVRLAQDATHHTDRN